jgi:hypothetical protein
LILSIVFIADLVEFDLDDLATVGAKTAAFDAEESALLEVNNTVARMPR